MSRGVGAGALEVLGQGSQFSAGEVEAIVLAVGANFEDLDRREAFENFEEEEAANAQVSHEHTKHSAPPDAAPPQPAQ